MEISWNWSNRLYTSSKSRHTIIKKNPMPTFSSNIRKGFLDGRVVYMYVARNRYNEGHQSRGFETRFTEFLFNLACIGSRITSPWLGFEFCGQGITLEQAWSQVIPPQEIPGRIFALISICFFFLDFLVLSVLLQKNTTQYITPGGTSDNGLYGDAPPDGAREFTSWGIEKG